MNSILQTLEQQLGHSLTGLTATQTQLRPIDHPEKWSIQQITEHLLLTYAATATALQARLDKGTPTQARPTLQDRIRQFAVTTLGYFPQGRQAPLPVTPAPQSAPLAGPDLLALATQSLSNLDQLLDRIESLFGQKRAVNHMILGPLNPHQWRTFQLRHGVHHIQQILAIRKSHNL